MDDTTIGLIGRGLEQFNVANEMRRVTEPEKLCKGVTISGEKSPRESSWLHGV
jgi:hypothetical protein